MLSSSSKLSKLADLAEKCHLSIYNELTALYNSPPVITKLLKYDHILDLNALRRKDIESCIYGVTVVLQPPLIDRSI